MHVATLMHFSSLLQSPFSLASPLSFPYFASSFVFLAVLHAEYTHYIQPSLIACFRCLPPFQMMATSPVLGTARARKHEIIPHSLLTSNTRVVSLMRLSSFAFRASSFLCFFAAASFFFSALFRHACAFSLLVLLPSLLLLLLLLLLAIVIIVVIICIES